MSNKLKAISAEEIEGVIITIQLPNGIRYELFFDDKRDGLVILKATPERKHIIARKDTDRQLFIK